jgi:hypothetical protein
LTHRLPNDCEVGPQKLLVSGRLRDTFDADYLCRRHRNHLCD